MKLRLIRKMIHTNDDCMKFYFDNFLLNCTIGKADEYYIETDETDLFINGKRFVMYQGRGTIKDIEEYVLRTVKNGTRTKWNIEDQNNMFKVDQNSVTY